MFIEVLIIPLIIIKLLGRNLKKIDEVHIKGWEIILIGVILQLLSFFFASRRLSSLSGFFINNFKYINFLTYGSIIIILFMNIKLRGFKLMTLGNVLNFIPMLINNGKMPVYIGALNHKGLLNQKDLLLSQEVLTHSIVDKTFTPLVLADIIPIPSPYIIPRVISIGDIFLSIGIIIFIFYYTRENKN